MPKLIILLQEEEWTAELQEGSNVLGRASQCGVPLKDPGLSRQHCEVFLSGGGATLLDKGSMNGTHLNGKRVWEAKLKPGDRISIGQTTIWYETKDDPVPAPAAPVRKSGPTLELPADYAFHAGGSRLWVRGAILLACGAALAGLVFAGKGLLSGKAGVRVDRNNLVGRNASFDRVSGGGPESWALRGRSGGRLSVDPAQGTRGSPCLVLERSADLRGLVSECAFADDLPLGRNGRVELSVMVRSDAFPGRVGFKVDWLRASRGPVVAEEFSDLVSPGSSWTRMEAVLRPPANATAFRVALAAVGRSGRILFDDVSVRSRPETRPPESAKIGPFRAMPTRQGILQIELDAQRTLVNLGALLESDREGITRQAFASGVSSTAADGEIRFEGAMSSPADFRDVPFKQTLSASEEGLSIAWRFPGAALQQVDRVSVAMALPRGDTIEGTEGEVSRIAIRSVSGDLGIEYTEPARVTVREESGIFIVTQSFPVRATEDEAVVGLTFLSGSGGGGSDPLQAAARARAKGDPGRAMAILRRHMEGAQDPAAREQARREWVGLEEAERKEWADLQAVVFSGRAEEVQRAREALAAYRKRWQGDAFREKADMLEGEMVRDLASASDPEGERAKRILETARRCAEGGRAALARAMLQALMERYPASDAAGSAQELLGTLGR